MSSQEPEFSRRLSWSSNESDARTSLDPGAQESTQSGAPQSKQSSATENSHVSTENGSDVGYGANPSQHQTRDADEKEFDKAAARAKAGKEKGKATLGQGEDGKGQPERVPLDERTPTVNPEGLLDVRTGSTIRNGIEEEYRPQQW